MPPLPRLRPILVPDLSAKIRWRRLLDRNPLFVTLQDKFAVREYARERGVACAPLIHVTEDPETIPFDSLPQNCMVKASHGWGWNVARIDGNYIMFGDGSRLAGLADPAAGQPSTAERRLSVADVIATCRKWLASRHRHREWAYRSITPRIVVEEMLVPRVGPELHDFRLYTFGGQVHAISVGCARYRRDKLNVFLRPDWSVIPLTRSTDSLPPSIPPRPDTLPEMIDIARRMGRDLDFVRVDLYDTRGGVVLGEMTIYPDGGERGMPSGCPALDGWLGNQWRMSPARYCTTVGLNVAEWVLDTVVEIALRNWCRILPPRGTHSSIA